MITIDMKLGEPQRFWMFGRRPDFGIETVARAIAYYNRYVVDDEPSKVLNFQDDFYKKSEKKKRETLEKLIEQGILLVADGEPTVQDIARLKPYQGILMLQPQGIFDPRVPAVLGMNWNRMRKKATSLTIGKHVKTQHEADRPKNQPRVLINEAYEQADPNVDYLGYEFQGLRVGTEQHNKVRLADLIDGINLFAYSNAVEPERITIEPYTDVPDLEVGGGRFIVTVKSFSGKKYGITLGNIPLVRSNLDEPHSLWRSIEISGEKRCGKAVYDAFHHPQKGLKKSQRLSDGAIAYLDEVLHFEETSLPQPRRAPTTILCHHVIASLIKLRQLTIENKRGWSTYDQTTRDREIDQAAIKFKFYYRDLPFIPLSENVIGRNGFDRKLRRVGFIVEDEQGFRIRTRNYTQREICLNRAFADFGPEWFNAEQGWRYDWNNRNFLFLENLLKISY